MPADGWPVGRGESLHLQQVLGYAPLEAAGVYLPLVAGLIVAAGAGSPLVPRLGVRPVLAAGMASWPSVPALRSRLHEQMSSTCFAFAAAFAPRLGKDPTQMEVHVLAAACAAALSVAVKTWANSQRELTRTVDEALAALEGF